MIKTRFSLANVFYVRRCRGAGATGQLTLAAASGQSSGLAKTNFMENDGGSGSHRQKI